MLQVNVMSEVARFNAALPDSTIAYIAGLFDGEGCVFITRQLPSAKRPELRSPTYSLGLKIAMGHESTIRWLQHTFGFGSIHTVHGVQHNRAWAWALTSNRAEVVLRVLRPLLRVKLEEADIALAFAALPRTRGSRKTPAEVTSKRDEFYVALRRAKPSNLFREVTALALLNDQEE